MTITYQWTIQQMDCVPEIQGDIDFVVVAHWTVQATDGTYSSSAYGTQGFTYDGSKNFTPFNELTQEQVVGWVQEGMGAEAVAALEASLDQQIADQINPPIVTPALPWVSDAN